MVRVGFVRRLGALNFLPILLILLTAGLCPAQTAEKSDATALSLENAAMLQALQAEGKNKGYSFKVGSNPATKYNLDDLCGLKKPKNWRTYAPFTSMAALVTDLPSEFDWRAWGIVPPVRNQGQCGSCWSFGVVGPLESQIKMYCSKDENLSEQFLVSCNTSGYGCNGGWFDAHNYHLNRLAKGQSEAGAVLESAMPYSAQNLQCSGSYSHPYKISSWSYITGYPMPSVRAIKQAIYNYGPVAAAVCVGNNFQYYKSGIFNADDVCSGTINHAIMLVGWVDDLGTDNGYWILRNSWGPYWGENGYMRIRYGKSKVGYAANFVEYKACGGGGDPGPLPEPETLPCDTAEVVDPNSVVNGAVTPDSPESKSVVDSYSGCSWLEEGTENVYKVTTTVKGDLKATLSSIAGDEIDVFILQACDPSTTLAYGDNSATYANAPVGTYYIIVDGVGRGTSYNLSVQSLVPAPDLVGAITRLTSSRSGTTIGTTLRISNAGKRAASSFSITLYQSLDGINPDLSAPVIKTKTYSRLAAGSTAYLSFTYSSPASLHGKYFLLQVDSGQQVAESNESNNTAFRRAP